MQEQLDSFNHNLAIFYYKGAVIHNNEGEYKEAAKKFKKAIFTLLEIKNKTETEKNLTH